MMNIIKQLYTNFNSSVDIYYRNWRISRTNAKRRKEIRRIGRELKEAKRQADLLHKANGKTYYVLPDYTGTLRVLDKAAIKNLKRFKVMSKEANVVNLLTESEYNTMNNQFLVLFEWDFGAKKWEFFQGTILEAQEKYSTLPKTVIITIFGGHERISSMRQGIIKNY